MEYVTRIKPVLAHTNRWIVLWVGLVCSYITSIKYKFYIQEWDYVVFAIQLAMDTCIITYAYLAYQNRSKKIARTFYFLIFISLIPEIMTNEIYNVCVNLMGTNAITQEVNVVWKVVYSAFLSIQIIAWSYLILMKKRGENSQQEGWLVKLPYVQSAGIILVSLISISVFNGFIINEMGINGIINSSLEIVVFVLILMCLSRSVNKSLVYIEMGFLLLMAFNLAHRFSHVIGQYQCFKVLDVVWLLAFVIVVQGLILSKKENTEEITFLEKNAIQVLTSGVFIIFANATLFLFIAIEFLMIEFEKSHVTGFSLLVQNTPSVLVFLYALTFLVAKVLSVHMSKPLEHISKRIDKIGEDLVGSSDADNKLIKIHEVNKLEQFIMSSITKLHVANRVKSNFLMNMSHDFRTPASGIYHASRTIYKRIDDPILKNLQLLVIDSSGQLMNYFEDMLDFSRLDNEQYESTKQMFSVNRVVDDIILLLSIKAEEKNILLGASDLNEDIEYVGDKLMFHRIMLNLVSNAIKFTDIGSVYISINQKTMDDQQWVCIQVKDTGIGIDKAYHSAIFESFYRIESGETARQSGLGLGLANVCLMLKKMNGKITLESILGVGSVFTIYLPCGCGRAQ